LEKRHNYIIKCIEFARHFFLDSNGLLCESTAGGGLVVAGSAQCKEELVACTHFDPQLKKRVLQVVDVSYGMDAGFVEVSLTLF
jgi:peptide subunit release factor 1 (eRF1)